MYVDELPAVGAGTEDRLPLDLSGLHSPLLEFRLRRLTPERVGRPQDHHKRLDKWHLEVDVGRPLPVTQRDWHGLVAESGQIRDFLLDQKRVQFLHVLPFPQIGDAHGQEQRGVTRHQVEIVRQNDPLPGHGRGAHALDHSRA